MNKNEFMLFYKLNEKRSDNTANMFNISLYNNRTFYQVRVERITENGCYVKSSYSLFYDMKNFHIVKQGFISFKEIKSVALYQKGDINKTIFYNYANRRSSTVLSFEEKKTIFEKYNQDQVLPHEEDDGEIKLL